MRIHIIAIGTVLLAGCAASQDSAPASVDWQTKSLAEVQRLAKSNVVPAEVELGRRYGTGTGVPQDYAKAVALFTEAVKSDNALAEYYLGTAYELGAGVAKDEAHAVVLYQSAVRQGQRDAEFRLANMVIQGRGGISPTWDGAIPLLQSAAEQDLVRAQFLLANCYATGHGVDKNSETAAMWYRRAIKLTNDNKPAVDRLRLLIDLGEVKWQPGDPGEPPANSGAS
jgi:TPR repeat protein